MLASFQKPLVVNRRMPKGHRENKGVSSLSVSSTSYNDYYAPEPRAAYREPKKADTNRSIYFLPGVRRANLVMNANPAGQEADRNMPEAQNKYHLLSHDVDKQ